MRSTGIRNTTKKLSIVLVILSLSISGIAGAGIVAAQEDPGQPHNFYGAVVDEDDTPAPAGIEIFALIDGDVEDSIIVEESGRYGGGAAFEDKLTVGDGSGEEVVFTLNSPDGPEALESPFDFANADGGVTELDLTFPGGAFQENPAAFQVQIDESASTLEAEEGGDLTVVADVENLGEEQGTQDVVAAVDGDQVGAEPSLTLAGRATETVTFEFQADPTYDGRSVDVASDDDMAAAALTVTESGGGGDDGDGADGGDGGDGGDEADSSDGTNGGGADGGDGNGANGDTGGGGQGDDDGGSADAIATSTGATINFRDAAGGQRLGVEVPSVASETGTSAVTGMDITPTFSNSDFRVEFTPPQESTPEGTPALGQDHGEARSYFTAEAIGIEDSGISGVNFTFTLAESEIPEDRSMDEVRLFRHSDGEWVTLETTHLGGDEFRARSPGFTAYAIGLRNAQADGGLSVIEGSLDSETVSAGEPATVSATVENTGGERGTLTVSLTAGGESLTTRDVTVDADASETVSFETRFDEAGTYDIAVNDVSAGTLTVEEPSVGSATEAAPSTAADTTTESAPGFGPLGAVVAVLAAVFFVRSRR